jgi:MFS transporter, ACS family, solute carrier family 17 (sodium-dependent inorganic phosphate cotransporter), member 5
MYVFVAGMFGAGVALIGLSFLDCTKTVLAVVLLIVAVTISGCVYSGYFVNHMDIAPQYAGTLMGIANGIAASSGFIAPYVASVLTKSVSVFRQVDSTLQL